MPYKKFNSRNNRFDEWCTKRRNNRSVNKIPYMTKKCFVSSLPRSYIFMYWKLKQGQEFYQRVTDFSVRVELFNEDDSLSRNSDKCLILNGVKNQGSNIVANKWCDQNRKIKPINMYIIIAYYRFNWPINSNCQMIWVCLKRKFTAFTWRNSWRSLLLWLLGSIVEHEGVFIVSIAAC